MAGRFCLEYCPDIIRDILHYLCSIGSCARKIQYESHHSKTYSCKEEAHQGPLPLMPYSVLLPQLHYEYRTILSSHPEIRPMLSPKHAPPAIAHTVRRIAAYDMAEPHESLGAHAASSHESSCLTESMAVRILLQRQFYL